MCFVLCQEERLEGDNQYMCVVCYVRKRGWRVTISTCALCVMSGGEVGG